MASAEVTAPIRMAICCRSGVAPTRKPVLRSWLVAPAFPAATAMTPAMVRAPTRWSTPVQPIRRKIVAVPISAAMVMPEIGLALTPISPVMREETTTKKNPKITISTAPSRLTASCGSKVRISASTTAPTGVTQMGRSTSVRTRAAASPTLRRRSSKPERNAATMVGSARTSAMIPAVATAPAPM